MTERCELETCQDGDRIALVFDPPVHEEGIGHIEHAEGVVRRIVGMVYLMADSHRTRWCMPPCLEVKAGAYRDLRLLERAAQAQARRDRKARGELIFTEAPRSAAEIEAWLSDLAGMIAEAPKSGARHGRRDELGLQFDDIADLVALARRKRNYLLTRARLGSDFHPWTIRDDRVFRIETVRPLPADFELDPEARRNRDRRLDEAVRIFGEAERETRTIAGQLRALGYDVRRPHPNAQELRVRFTSGKGRADLQVAASANGFWEAAPCPPDNKTKARILASVLRQGHLERLKAELALIVG